MLISKVLKGVLVPLAIYYIVLQGQSLDIQASGIGALMLVLLTILYAISKAPKRKYFFAFLIVFTITEIIDFFTWFTPPLEMNELDYFYYIANILYIVSYLFLILNLIIDLNLKLLIAEFKIPIIILIVLDIFSVMVISSTTENALNSYQFILEFVYNAVIMVLLSVALLNYMYRNDNKSMLLLVGCIFIMFYEIIQLAYFYVLDDNELSIIFSMLLVIAFTLFYVQSQLKFTGPERAYVDEQLES